METSETIRLLEQRVSVRKFSPDAVSNELLEAVLQAACRAPTSSNLQAYSLIVIRDREKQKELSALAGDQPHVAETPVFVAVCADLSRVEQACAIHGMAAKVNTLEMGLVASVDAALVGMSLMLAAESVGLGCVMIGGMRNKPIEVARLLQLPPRAFVLFGMCLGWPLARPPQKPRLPAAAVIHYEEYGRHAVPDSLPDYDASLAQHYQDREKPAHPSAWTKRVADDFSKVRRPDLRESLMTLGLGFE